MGVSMKKEKTMRKNNEAKRVSIILALAVIMVFLLSFSGLAAETDSEVLLEKSLTATPQIQSFSISLTPVQTSSSLDLFQIVKPQSAIPQPQAAPVKKSTEINLNASKYFQRYETWDRVENSLFTTSMVTLVALNIADYFSTKEALKYEGLQEGNPIMKPFVKNDLTFAAVKIGLTVGNYYLMKKMHKNNKTLAWAVSLVSNFVMSYVVANNMKMIQKARQGSF